MSLSMHLPTLVKNPDEKTPLLFTAPDQQDCDDQRRPSWERDPFLDDDDTPVYDRDESIPSPTQDESRWKYLKYAKIIILTAVMLFPVVALACVQEKVEIWSPVALQAGNPYIMNLTEEMGPQPSFLTVGLSGWFSSSPGNNQSQAEVFLTLERFWNGTYITIGEEQSISVLKSHHAHGTQPRDVQLEFSMETLEDEEWPCQLSLRTEESRPVSMVISVTPHAGWKQQGVILATAVMIGLYLMIIFELVHRTLAALIGASAAIGCLAAVGERPTLEKVLTWLDVQTLCLLFGMMVLVSILSETGFFDYISVLAYRLAKGKVWPLITMLCAFTAVIAAFLDNVTTILLMTPVTIRLCEAMNLDPKPILIASVLFSNIGGAATPVGDPPNVLIISNPDVIRGGIDFTTFTAHAMPGVIFCALGGYVLIRLMYWKIVPKGPQDPAIEELRREIEVWKKACFALSRYSKDENSVRKILKRKVMALEKILSKSQGNDNNEDTYYLTTLEDLTSQYKIRNKVLLIKTGIVLVIVILLFFLQSLPDLYLRLGWIAILASIVLLILADIEDIETIIARVEWSTLLFFAGLFVVMEAVTELGLLKFIGESAESWIESVNEDQRLPVAILLIIWLSAIASTFIDNIPFTTVMIKIVAQLANNKALGLPLMPLVFALVFGACLGGNGSIVGASANVVCAGVAEQHGYHISFMDFFKIGFPMMLVTIGISNVYLVICHLLIGWNS